MLPLRPLLAMWPVATPDSASALAPSVPSSSPASAVSAPPSPRIHLSVFAALLVLFFVFVVPAVRSPLRRIPGPRLARFTSAVLRWNEFQGRRTLYVHELHKRYGPVVRLAPNEVSFASAAAVKDIYGSAGSGYDKTDFYNLFTVYGRRTMFSTLNKENHAHRRRILADRYANTNVMKPSSLSGIETRSRVFAQLCGDAVDGIHDIYISLHSYAFDCVTHHLFHPYGTDSLRNKDDERIMREVTFDSSLQNRLISYHYPTLHSLTGSLLALFMKPRETPLARQFVLETSARPDPAPFTLLSRMNEKRQKEKEAAMATPDVEKNANFDLLDAAAESMDHMAAGIDTTGDALCFLMWELSQPRSMAFQERLRRELLDNAHKADPLPFDRLPLLDAIVQEGLRCFPAIPMSLPRVVPGRAWGMRASRTQSQNQPTGPAGMDGRLIDGYFLPAGTVVSSQAYSVHRLDTSVFPEPDTFNPDRWMTDDGDAERKRLFFAFASGGRGCVGKHLALAEMKLLLRDIYSRFATAPEASMTDEAMSMSDQIISTRPLGQRCLLKFTPLDELSKE